MTLNSLFKPACIAVVGASADPKKIGSVILKNILDAGYTGRLYAVNPKYQELEKMPCVPNVGSISEPIDLVVVSVPADKVMAVAQECGEKGVKSLIVISAGFGEIGEQGQLLEKQLIQIAAEFQMRLLGPNCLGVIAPHLNLNVSFAAGTPKPGGIAFLSQSGAVNTALLDMAAPAGLGFSHFVSIGNKADITELDLLDYWMSDPQVEVIGMYLEEFADGRDLLEMAKSTRKPVVILHPGKSKQAQTAITSHTGSLANSAAIVEAALRQSGIIQVDSIEEMFAVLAIAQRWNKASSGQMAILTNAGGPGIVATDAAVAASIELAEISDSLQVNLQNTLPNGASVHNPIDLLGDATADRYSMCLDLCLADSKIQSVLILLTPQFVTEIEATSHAIAGRILQSVKPVIPVYLGQQRVSPGIDILWQFGIPSFTSLETALKAYGKFCLYQKQIMNLPPSPDKILAGSHPAHDLPQANQGQVPQALAPELVQNLLRESGIPMPNEVVAADLDVALAFAARIGYPIVLKATTEDIVHKTDFKAIYLNIKDSTELTNRFIELQGRLRNLTGKQLVKVLIQEQVEGEEELFIGVQRDGSADVYKVKGLGFGHALVIGKGGIYTEVYQDTATGLIPLSLAGVRELIGATNVSKIIRGTRGQKPLAEDQLVSVIAAIQKMVLMYPQIVSMDINPLMIDYNRCVAVDAKIFVG